MHLPLCPAEFVTYQVDKGPSTGKVWGLNRKATLEPPSSKFIRQHERHLRKAGPLRALSAYARDKNLLTLVSSCSGVAVKHQQLLAFVYAATRARELLDFSRWNPSWQLDS